jgi:hypothetical protein
MSAQVAEQEARAANLPDGVMFGMDIIVTWRSAAGGSSGRLTLTTTRSPITPA